MNNPNIGPVATVTASEIKTTNDTLKGSVIPITLEIIKETIPATIPSPSPLIIPVSISVPPFLSAFLDFY